MAIYLPKHILAQEVVPPEIYQAYGQNSFRFVSQQLLRLADATRDFFNKPMIINTWHSPSLIQRYGLYKSRGFRPITDKTGSPDSAHRRGMSLDFNIEGMTDADVYKAICDHYNDFFKTFGLTAIEDGTFDPKTGIGWNHMACENWLMEELKHIPFYGNSPWAAAA